MKKRRYFNIVFLFLVTAAIVLFSEKGIEVMKSITNRFSENKTIVVLDAGHGGFDPGKVGINHALESEINLEITYKLKTFLEQNDITVIMTRLDGNGLYSESDSNKKNSDLKRRVEIIENSNAVLAVSIHQNSFEQESSKGAQVFYHDKSVEGKALAEIIQEQIKQTIGDDNKRVAKSNNTYYMLKKTTCPLVIAECGFLSNQKEAELLVNEEYQEKMAWAVHLGIMRYLSQRSEK